MRRHPLSFPQLGLWFLNELQGTSLEYHIPEALRISGALDAGALQRALRSLVERHETLRTTFALEGDEPVQIVQDAADVPLAIEDLPLASEPSRAAAVDAAYAEEWRRPFDLAAGPLLRARLLRFAADDHALVLTTHHIASDGWSQGILRRELGELYDAARAGEPARLPPLTHRYVDFAAWQRELVESGALEPSIAFWKRSLAGLPDEIALSFRRPPEAGTAPRGDLTATSVGPDLARRLRELSRSNAATLNMTLLAAFAVLLAREGGARDFPIATPVAGRTRAEFEPVVGFFVNTLPIRFALEPDAPFADVVRRTRDATLLAYEHQDVPFERVVQELAPPRAPGRRPLAQVMFGLHDDRDAGPRLDGAGVAPVEQASALTRFDLELHVFERPDDLYTMLVYDETAVDDDTATALLQAYVVLLEDLAAGAPSGTGAAHGRR